MSVEPALASSTPTAADPARHGSRTGVLGWLGALGSVFLGAILLVGAWAKAIHPSAFVEQIGTEGLDFLLPASAVAMIALALEAGLGTALVLLVRRLWILIPTALLVVFFLFLTGRTYYLTSQGLVDPAAGCGCFGNLVERTPAQAFWQDLALLVPALLLAFLGRRRGPAPITRTAIAAVAALGIVVLAWQAPRLPLDDLATRLKPGVAIADLCGGQGNERLCLSTIRPELESGEHLVVIGDLEDASWSENAPALNQAVSEGRDVLVLAAATPEQVTAFFWQWGPAFEIVEVPEGVLAPLYRQLPRSFRVVDGEVVETWSGLPPAMVGGGEMSGEASAL